MYLEEVAMHAGLKVLRPVQLNFFTVVTNPVD